MEKLGGGMNTTTNRHRRLQSMGNSLYPKDTKNNHSPIVNKVQF